MNHKNDYYGSAASRPRTRPSSISYGTTFLTFCTSAFQSPELNSPAFQLLGLKLSNPSAFQSLGLVSPILLHFYHLDSTLGHPYHWVSIICHSNDRDSRLNLTAFQSTHSAASRPRSGAFGPSKIFCAKGTHSAARGLVLTRPLRDLVQGPSAPQKFSAPKVLTRPLAASYGGLRRLSIIFYAKGTHSAASRPRSGAFGPLSNFLRQRYSLGRFAASYSLGRFAASYGGLRRLSIIFCAKGVPPLPPTPPVPFSNGIVIPPPPVVSGTIAPAGMAMGFLPHAAMASLPKAPMQMHQIGQMFTTFPPPMSRPMPQAPATIPAPGDGIPPVPFPHGTRMKRRGPSVGVASKNLAKRGGSGVVKKIGQQAAGALLPAAAFVGLDRAFTEIFDESSEHLGIFFFIFLGFCFLSVLIYHFLRRRPAPPPIEMNPIRSRRPLRSTLEAINGQFLCNRPITCSYAFKKDTKGELHGTTAERLLAAQNPLFPQDRPHQIFSDIPGLRPMPQPPVMPTTIPAPGEGIPPLPPAPPVAPRWLRQLRPRAWPWGKKN
ncbi:hypothetical protein niasHT_029253 [Heterodera trifolii]|uniref:Uncharacterized protein n=1 Tax=Heterodera trifolii TaxID=157864 RepID=A0ABD2JUM9_9BILA